MTLANSLKTAFKEAAEQKGLNPNVQLIQAALSRIGRFLEPRDHIVSENHEHSGKLLRVFVPFARDVKIKSNKKKSIPIVCISVLFDKKNKKITLSSFRTRSHLVDILLNDSGRLEKRAFDIKHPDNTGNKCEYHSFKELQDYLMSEVAASLLRLKNTVSEYTKDPNTRAVLAGLFIKTSKPYLEKRVHDFIGSTIALLDQNIWNDVNKFLEKFPQAASNLTFYNFVLSGHGAHSARNRLGALHALKRLHPFILDAKVAWAEIDSGAPVFNAFAKQFGLKPHTFKRMIECNLEVLIDKNRKAVNFLDTLDFQYWPKDNQEKLTFETVFGMCNSYAQTFNKNSFVVMKDWIKNANGPFTWRALFIDKIAGSLKALEQNELERTRYKLPERIRPAPIEGETPLAYSARQEPWADYAKRALGQRDNILDLGKAYVSEITNIRDLYHDISAKIFYPIILIECEKRGYFITQLSRLRTDELQTRLWEKVLPHEIIEASRYWHSPRVNFSNRVNSSGLVNTEWSSFVHEAFAYEDRVFIPLNSSAKLVEEGKEMNHCVWSFTSRCLLEDYHVFSMRDAAGNRKSTLSVIHKVEPDGSNVISLYENRSSFNHNPDLLSVKAANAFIEAVNNNRFECDWARALNSRLQYKRNKAEIAIGYNYRDPEVTAKVLETYIPCLPRYITKGGVDLDKLADILDVKSFVDGIFASEQTEGLGLTKIQTSSQYIPQGPA